RPPRTWATAVTRKLSTSLLCSRRTRLAASVAHPRGAVLRSCRDRVGRRDQPLHASSRDAPAITISEAVMSNVRVHNFSISLDGFGTGDGITADAPFGHAGERLHEWMFATRFWRSMVGQPGGTVGVDHC